MSASRKWSDRRCRLITCSVLLLLAQIPARAQGKYEAYPDYLDVLERLYSGYQVEREGCTPKLAKKPDGWWLVFQGVDSVEAEQQLWSYRRRSYLKPDLPKLKRNEEQNGKQKFADSDWTAAYYRACPYFGYRGWYLDVISEYGMSEGLPAHVQYGVGRAYSSAAAGRLDDLQAEALPGYCFLSDTNDVLSTEELAEYRWLGSSACAWYGKVVESDPLFETHVGEATLKRDNEFMTCYMNLFMVHGETAALGPLPDNLYEPFYRSVAKNYLASCDSNAILFTNGDNDTYPLWYEQVVEGYRRDVLVLNLSLLNASRYVMAMRNGHLGSAPIGWQLPNAFYWNALSSYARLGSTTDTLNLSDVMDLLMAAHASSNGTNKEEISLSTKRFSLDGPDGMKISWTIPKPYILRNALAVFDILSKHAAHRSIHWAVTTGPDSYLGLSDHLSLQGLTYKLMFDDPMTKHSSAGVPARVNGERGSELFLDEFDWAMEGRSTPNKTRFVTNYILQMSNTAEELARRSDTTQARAVLDRCIALFPNDPWTYSRIMLRPMEVYRSLGAEERADSLARILIHNLKTLPEVDETLYPANADEELRIRKAVVDRIRSNAEEHQRQGLVSEIDMLPATWPDPLVIRHPWPSWKPR